MGNAGRFREDEEKVLRGLSVTSARPFQQRLPIPYLGHPCAWFMGEVGTRFGDVSGPLETSLTFSAPVLSWASWLVTWTKRQETCGSR